MSVLSPGETAVGATTLPNPAYTDPKVVQEITVSGRTGRIRIAGELRRVSDLVDPIQEQMDAGLTRMILNIDELSMDTRIGLDAIWRVRSLRVQCGALIIWTRNPLECFRTVTPRC